MRILIIAPTLQLYGGAELVVVKLANYLKEKGHYVRILTLSVSDEIRKELNVPVLSVDKVFDSGIFGIIGQMDSLNMDIREIENAFDIINVHNFPAELALRKTTTPAVWYCNEPPTYWLNPEAKIQFPHKMLLWYEKRIVRDYVTKACVADSFNYLRYLERYNSRPKIIPYGIDYNFFSKGDRKKAIENYRLKDKFVVLQVGVVTEQKNQLRSIQAIEKLKNKIPNIRLVLAGNYNSYYASQLMQYSLNHKLTHHIVFLGNINRNKLRDLYTACDVLIHPIKSQGGWLVPFECMCSGKPVIVSSEFTSEKLIRDNLLGFQVVDNYEGRIIDLYNKPYDDREQEDVKMYVKEKLTWEKFGEKMIEVFEEVIRK